MGLLDWLKRQKELNARPNATPAPPLPTTTTGPPLPAPAVAPLPTPSIPPLPVATSIFPSRPPRPAKPQRTYGTNLRTWVRASIQQGAARGDLVRVMGADWDAALEASVEMVLGDVSQKLEDVMVDRNMKGQALERDGSIGAAVRLYEANVQDRHDGYLPYDRLVRHYCYVGRIEDAQRVAATYAAVPNHAPTILSELQARIERTLHPKPRARGTKPVTSE